MPITGEQFDEDTSDLLALLRKKIKDGTISASEQLNYIRLQKESGHIWFRGAGVKPAKPLTEGVPFDGDDQNDVIPFPISK
jgi:hypothetical protein